MVAYAGNRIYASDVNRYATPIVGFGQRTTNGTTTTTSERSYLRVDSIPIVSGEAYTVWTSPLILESSVAADEIQVYIHYSTTGAATTSDTTLTVLAGPSKTASGNQSTNGLNVLYVAGVTGSLSVLMSYVRADGSGNVRINASASIPAQLVVERKYTGPSDTGTDL